MRAIQRTLRTASRNFNPAKSHAFVPGQLWRLYRCPEDADALLIVGKLHNFPNYGTIVHIQIINVKIIDIRNPGKFVTTVTHMPIPESILKESVIELVGTSEPRPGFQPAYETWSNSEQGVSVLTLTPARLVAIMNDAHEQRLRQSS